MDKLKRYGIPLIGPLLFIIFFNLDLGLNDIQAKFFAVFIFVVYNWLIAKLPLFVTGFIGVGLSVLLGVEPSSTALASFANPIIFLFLAGFLFAKAMSEIGLDKRISLFILSQKFVGKSFDRMLLSFFALTAFFSMWVSNTATAAMMMPIMLGMAKSLNIKCDKTLGYMLLGLAYSASVGGIGSPVGSTPNIIAIGMLRELAGIQMSFAQWIFFGLPLVFIFILIIFGYVKKRIPEGSKAMDMSFIKNEVDKLAPLSGQEKWLMFLFSLLVASWFLPGFLSEFFGGYFPVLKTFSKRMEPGVVGMFFASMLFVFPLGKESKLLAPTDIKDVDWGSLLLFGAGLSLGKTLFSVGLAQIAGNYMVEHIAGSSFFILILVLSYFTIFATELASNTASANIIIPIIIAAAEVLKVNTMLPVIAVALCCSLAFMLPVATPPNAIVYGSGKIEIPTMIRFGFVLNIIFGLVITFVFYGFNFFMS